MSATRYGFLELWDDLERNYNTFTSENTICTSSQEDVDAYEKARTALKDMIDIGREAQAITLWYPFQKVELSIKAKDSFARHFGPDQIPPVKGAKSLAFLKDVMLPHIERSLTVEVDPISMWLGTTFIGVNFEAEASRARELVKIYKGIIAKAENAMAEKDAPVNDVAEEAVKKAVGEQFRLFASSCGERMSAPVPDIVTAAAMPRL